MKKVLLTLIALLVIAVPGVMAAETSGDVYAGVYGKYMWRGFDLSGNTAVAQGGMDISIDKVTFSYWTNMQLVDNDRDGFNAGDANETDIVIDYSTDLSELVSLSVGNILYDVDGFESTNELYVSLGFNTILAPAVTAYYDYDEGMEKSLFYTLSIGHDLAISEKYALSLGALVSYNQESDFGVGVYNGLHNYELSASVDVPVTEALSVNVSALFSEPISDNARQLINSESTGGVSLTYAF